MPEAYSGTTFENVVLTILAILVIIISVGCIYAFFRAIFLFIFSGGKEERITGAWSSIRYMIMGIILTVVILFLFPYVFKWMKLPNYENFDAKHVFTRAGELISKAFSVKDVIIESQKENQYRGDLYYDEDNLPFDSEGYRL